MNKTAIRMVTAAIVLFSISACANKHESASQAMGDTSVETIAETAVEDSATDSSKEAEAAATQESALIADADGYFTTPSGLKYRVIEEGNGPVPSRSSKVRVRYEGKLTDGRVFENTFSTPDAPLFPLANLIPGWIEGLQMMKEGSTYEFYIPSNLGYGDRQAGPIPPNSDLIFKIELIEVQ